jgi:hypothetical protein
VHGAEYADKSRQRMEAQGHISAVQRYFGLHYLADEMPQGNDEYLALMRERGFEWFEPWHPVEEAPE